MSEPTAHCAACGVEMACNPGPDCWCAQLPFEPMPEKPVGCLCPDCFAAAPHPDRLLNTEP